MGGKDTRAPLYSSGEIGDTDTLTVEIAFNERITAAGDDYSTGVTIYNGVAAQTIVSGTLQGDSLTVFYVILAAADIDDVLTWEYASAGGAITDLAGNALEDVTAQTATNYIGSQFYFNDFNSSGHFAHL